MTSRPQLLLSLAVLAAGALGAIVLVATSPETPHVQPEPAVPLIRTVDTRASDVQIRVATHGTVEPRTESDLVSEVSGRVLWISPALVAGGFFAEDEPLLRVEPHDYETALERARAQLARAESEAALTARDAARQSELAKQSVASAARLDDATNRARAAAAALREARAALEQAQRDLERTELRAPFAGRVRGVQADVGQFVSRGTPLARLYAIDWAEVRLPIRDEDLAWIDVPQIGAERGAGDAPPVILRARYAGAEREWRGHIERSEGEIDAQSRMVHLVARVEDPYARREGATHSPLPVGLFVEAEILGRTETGIVVLPRSALRTGDQVLVVDEEDRLQFRNVTVLRRDQEDVLIREGLTNGERVNVTALEAPVEGMRVRPVADAAPAPATAETTAPETSS